ncbi:MAG: hypothetical protein HQM10_11465 [Candidatus Riflebacteria bacterium]|nr:hypothetical protein [Candidatus Riflebacteria bacterium]
MKTVRFFSRKAFSAYENMAIDEALVIETLKQPDSGFIRFYQWQPYSLSFGIFQHPEKIISLPELEKAGIQAVRRSSGGKMVFHADEITFSVALPVKTIENKLTHLQHANFLDLFQALISPFIAALNKHGVPAEFSQTISRRDETVVHCYDAPAAHSIMASGKKLVGAAGIKKDHLFFIHGSMPFSKVLPYEGIFLKKLDSTLKSDVAYLSEYISRDELTLLETSIVEFFGNEFSLKIMPSDLSESELDAANQLARQKYSNLFWK